MSVIETKFHLFQVQEKLVAGDPIVPLQLGLGITPEVLDAVDVAATACGKRLPMVDAVVPIALGKQAAVAGELVRVDRTALRHLLPDHSPERRPGRIGNWAGIDLPAPLQGPKDGDFAGRPMAPDPLAVPSAIGLVRFDLAAQRRSTFTVLGQVAANHLIAPFGTVAIAPECLGGLHGGNLQGKEVNELAKLTIG